MEQSRNVLSAEAIREIQSPRGYVLSSDDRSVFEKAGFEIVPYTAQSNLFRIVQPYYTPTVTDAKPFPAHQRPDDIVQYMRSVAVLRPHIAKWIQRSRHPCTEYLTHFERRVLQNAGCILSKNADGSFLCRRPFSSL